MNTRIFKNRSETVSLFLKAFMLFTAFMLMQSGNTNSQPAFPYADVKITASTQGMYHDDYGSAVTNDVFSAQLRNGYFPFDVMSATEAEIEKNTMEGIFRFDLPGSSSNEFTECYIVLKHRNSLEVWSSTPVRIFENQLNEFDFTVAANVYGNNTFNAGKRRVMLSGDANQDGFIDLEDYSMIENDVWNMTTGYTVTDLTGDNFVDIEDLVIIELNKDKFLSVKSPLNPEGLKRNNTATVTGNDITLNQNFPNPFNPSTSISFTLSSESPVKLSVYDIAGREVDVIINQNLQAGLHSYIWNAGNFSSGVYYFRLVSGDFSETKQMNLVK